MNNWPVKNKDDKVDNFTESKETLLIPNPITKLMSKKSFITGPHDPCTFAFWIRYVIMYIYICIGNQMINGK